MARLLLIGGGHSHLFVLESLAQRREAGVDTTLVSPSALTTYTGMVPGVLGGQYPLRAAQIDGGRLAQRAGGVRRRAGGGDRSGRAPGDARRRRRARP